MRVQSFGDFGGKIDPVQLATLQQLQAKSAAGTLTDAEKQFISYSVAANQPKKKSNKKLYAAAGIGTILAGLFSGIFTNGISGNKENNEEGGFFSKLFSMFTSNDSSGSGNRKVSGMKLAPTPYTWSRDVHSEGGEVISDTGWVKIWNKK